MRSRPYAVPAVRADRLLALLEQVEAATGELSAGEALEVIGRTARLDAVLRTHHAALTLPAASLPSDPDRPRYLDAEAAAAYLNISKSTLRRLVEAGKLRERRPSEGTVRFDREELDAYMAARGAVFQP